MYQPSTRMPGGTEVVAIFLSSSDCVANLEPGFKPAIRQMMLRLGRQRDSLSLGLSVMGVSVDWSTRDAIAYFQELGEFDELAVGRNWFGNTVLQRVWMTEGTVPTIPQVILLERTIDLGSNRVSVQGERLLGRYVGADAIRAWVDRGAPIRGDSTAGAADSSR